VVSSLIDIQAICGGAGQDLESAQQDVLVQHFVVSWTIVKLQPVKCEAISTNATGRCGAGPVVEVLHGYVLVEGQLMKVCKLINKLFQRLYVHSFLVLWS
jgi:hypothetical protein